MVNYPGYNQWNQPQQSGLIWVQGEAGAKSYLVAPGNTVLLLDSERQTFYIKSTDASGMPRPLKVYDFQERQEEPEKPAVDLSNYVTKDEMAAYIADLTKDAKKGKKNE